MANKKGNVNQVPRARPSIRDYIKLAAPEPEILTMIGENSKRRGTDKITMREIDKIIHEVRKRRTKRG